MSFRAQLAHAMLESQRMQMMAQANTNGDTNNGVSEEIQRTWKRWTYGSGGGSEKTQQSKDNTKNHNEDGKHDNDNDNNALSTPSRIQKAIMRLGSVGVGNGGYGTVSRMDQQEEEGKKDMKDEDLELGQNGGNADAEHDITCSICLCEYEEGDEVTMLPCNHVYHEACVKEWTGQSQRCPLCNHDLMSISMQDSSTSIAASRSASANNSASL